MVPPALVLEVAEVMEEQRGRVVCWRRRPDLGPTGPNLGMWFSAVALSGVDSGIAASSRPHGRWKKGGGYGKKVCSRSCGSREIHDTSATMGIAAAVAV
jgi:hypothetical protein